MDTLIANIKHWQTTAIGILVIAGALLQSPGVQTLASLNPKIAHIVGVAVSVVAGLTSIVGVGETTATPSQPPANTATFPSTK